jgi:two-component system chemotaxis response regulator CheY
MADKGIRALIVDDEEPLRGIMKIALTYFGIKVVGEAGDGLEAIDRYKELNPNVVLMDINMPRMDGLSATKEIVTLNPDAIVLLITASDDAAAMDKGRSLGAKGFLRKPLVMDELHRDILSHLRVQLAKEQGVQLEQDYYKYQIKPGFRPGDEGKHFEAPPMTGATQHIRERQKHLETPETHPEYQPEPQKAAPPAPPQPQADGVPSASAAKKAEKAEVHAAPISPTTSGSYRRMSPEVADILDREKSRTTGEVETLKAEVQRLKRALADAAGKLREVADDLSKAAK